MAFPLLEDYLRRRTNCELSDGVRLVGASPSSSRKADLIHALLQVCRRASVHEKLWNFLLEKVHKDDIKIVIGRRPPPGGRSTWTSANKASLIATVIRRDWPEAAQGQDDAPGLSGSSQVPSCGVLGPANRSQEALKARLRRTWLKKARRFLKHTTKKKQRSMFTRTALRKICAGNPKATIDEVQRRLEEATSLSFESGRKYLFFWHHLLKLLRAAKGPTRRKAPQPKWRLDVWKKSGTAADTQNGERHLAEQDAVSGVLVPWSPQK